MYFEIKNNKNVYCLHAGAGHLPEFATVGSRPRVAGIDIAALKFSTLSSVLKIATCNKQAIVSHLVNFIIYLVEKSALNEQKACEKNLTGRRSDS